MIRATGSSREVPPFFSMGIDRKVLAAHEYTQMDIANLLRCYLQTNDVCCQLANKVHVFYKGKNGVFLFPPFDEQAFSAYFSSFFKKFPTASEILVPWNKAEHWIVLRCIFRGKEIEARYIDSIDTEKPVEFLAEFAKNLQKVFRPHGFTLKTMVDPRGYPVQISVDHLRIQSDATSCGPIVVANILDLFSQTPIPAFPTRIDSKAALEMKESHAICLYKNRLSLDLDSSIRNRAQSPLIGNTLTGPSSLQEEDFVMVEVEDRAEPRYDEGFELI